MLDIIRSLVILLLMIPGYIMVLFFYLIVMPICFVFNLKPSFKYTVEKF